MRWWVLLPAAAPTAASHRRGGRGGRGGRAGAGEGAREQEETDTRQEQNALLGRLKHVGGQLGRNRPHVTS